MVKTSREDAPPYTRVKRWSIPFGAGGHYKRQWPGLLRMPMSISMLVNTDF